MEDNKNEENSTSTRYIKSGNMGNTVDNQDSPVNRETMINEQDNKKANNNQQDNSANNADAVSNKE